MLTQRNATIFSCTANKATPVRSHTKAKETQRPFITPAFLVKSTKCPLYWFVKATLKAAARSDKTAINIIYTTAQQLMLSLKIYIKKKLEIAIISFHLVRQ